MSSFKSIPKYNTNLWFKYKIGNIIKNSDNQLFFVVRTSGHLYYDIDIPF